MEKTLADIAVRARGMVLGFAKGATVYRQKLLAMGLIKGTAFQVAGMAPMGDPVEIRVRDSTSVCGKKRQRPSAYRRYHNGKGRLGVVDTPCIYSLAASSLDERSREIIFCHGKRTSSLISSMPPISNVPLPHQPAAGNGGAPDHSPQHDGYGGGTPTGDRCPGAGPTAGLVFLLYLIGIGFVVLTGLILKNTLLQGDVTPFYRETSLAWTAFAGFWTTFLAYLVLTLIYQIANFSVQPGYALLVIAADLGTFAGVVMVLKSMGAASRPHGPIPVTPPIAPGLAGER